MPNPLDDTVVYTLDDLKSWELKRPGLPPSLAVLGHPVAHSVSPQMHNAALAYLRGQDSVLKDKLKDWRYFKFEIEPDELEQALILLKEKNFQGTNLTVPHKNARRAITFLNLRGIENDVGLDLPVNVEVKLEKVKSSTSNEFSDLHPVNTLIFADVKSAIWGGMSAAIKPKTLKPVERIFAHNTDGYGLTQSLKRDLQVTVKGKTVVILGSGGAAVEAANECLSRHCAALWIGSRDGEKRAKLCDYLKSSHNVVRLIPSKFNPPEPGVEVTGFDINDASVAKNWPNDVIVINATTLGMKSGDALPFDVSLLGRYACVFDMVYNRQGPTKFVEAARARDLRASDGLGMLIWQGAKSLTLWIKWQEGIEIKPEAISQTMMDAALAPLGQPPRNV